VQVIGHTDSKGSDEYNLKLSRARAERVGRFLEQRYPNLKGHVEPEGRGEREPVAPNEVNGQDDPQGRRLNRRVVIEIATGP
jgi:outer membrane protein OmpA-like peptidoglycan-associated protein